MKRLRISMKHFIILLGSFFLFFVFFAKPYGQSDSRHDAQHFAETVVVDDASRTANTYNHQQDYRQDYCEEKSFNFVSASEEQKTR